ncbi:hypothetical protein [Vibrio coralliilyticus]|uniref:Uncharacterized protein n=1 Tax=Vibrio coralliilyticus TaxID=190893 RepID=A0AAP7DCC3_9VIBR|nr:hypothetical protein [Vibrio coralliilyticus]NOJ21205.1 hypothetical protein [Vibrio coralliilyticus]
MDKQVLANKFQVHYYFNDDSHSMDALVRHQCEAEIIAILFEVATTIDENIQIESEAHQEGGLRDIWKVANANAGILSVIVGIASLAIPLLPKSDSELERLQKEELRLSIEERKLRIEKLKAEVKSERVTSETVSKVAEVVNENYKVITRRSNLFKYLSAYPKVTKIGINGLTESGSDAMPELHISRAVFKKFVLPSHRLPIQTIDDAVIEIVSPVLRQGNYRWKGIWQGQNISFTMKDISFKQDVLSKQISFQHGSCIRCVMNIRSKLDHIGKIVITSFSVETVLEHGHGVDSHETPQGSAYHHRRGLEAAQGDLFETS